MPLCRHVSEVQSEHQEIASPSTKGSSAEAAAINRAGRNNWPEIQTKLGKSSEVKSERFISSFLSTLHVHFD